MELEKLRKEQENLSKRLKIKKLNKKIKIFGGCDVYYYKNFGIGAFILMNEKFEIVEKKFFKDKIDFPYIPGFLSYREIKFLIGAYKKLKVKPDLIFVDGNGILHPRKFGIASHLGLFLKKPTIGCAKNLLIGEYEKFELKKGNFSPVIFNSEVIGYAVCTKDNLKPVFVSPGNLIDFEDSIKYTLIFSKYRIPEPIRIAHIEAKNYIFKGV
ncbi:MAG: endonuclease V [candidate division WOR-3 bacterium]